MLINNFLFRSKLDTRNMVKISDYLYLNKEINSITGQKPPPSRPALLIEKKGRSKGFVLPHRRALKGVEIQHIQHTL